MLALLLSLVTAVPHLAFGEIFGDLRLGEKYLTQTKIDLKCGAVAASATTDSAGSFRIPIKATGKCTVTVTYEKQTASVDVVVFDKPARYRLVLEAAKDGKYTLKRV